MKFPSACTLYISLLEPLFLRHCQGILREVLQALFFRHKGKPDPNFTAKLTSAPKGELAQRLAARLGEVMEAGRDVEVTQSNSDGDCSGDCSELGDEDLMCRGSRARKRPGGVRPIEQAGEVPHDAVITAEQA